MSTSLISAVGRNPFLIQTYNTHIVLKDNIFRNMYFSDRLFYLHYSTTLTVENILFDNVSTETNFLDIEYA